MKFGRIIWVILIIVVLALLLPAYGFLTQAKGDASVSAKVQMSKDGITDTSPVYTIEFSTGAKAGYFEYVGIWWGNIMKPAQAELDWPRIGVDITVTGSGVRPEGSGLDRAVYSYGYSYEYGDQFSMTYKFNALHGDEVSVEVRIYDGWGMFTGLTETYVVP